MPRFDELSVAAMIHKFKDDPDLQTLLPVKLPKKRQHDRSYLFNCINTLYPGYVQKLVTYANEQRYDSSSKKDEEAVIEVTEDWFQQLSEVPFVSRKTIDSLLTFILERRGRTIHLLQKRAKRSKERQGRKKYMLFDEQADEPVDQEEEHKGDRDEKMSEEEDESNESSIRSRRQKKAAQDPAGR